MSQKGVLSVTRTQYKLTGQGRKYKVMLSWLCFSAILSTTAYKIDSEHIRD